MLSTTWAIQQLIPPALLTYFVWAWKLCALEVGLDHIRYNLGYPILGGLYTLFTTLLISTITIVFLRLYLLPSNQSVPPKHPVPGISARQEIFECLSPSETAAVHLANVGDVPVDGSLPGRDIAQSVGRVEPVLIIIFANCLTVSHVPTFLILLLLTPPTTIFLSSPLYAPLVRRAIAGYRLSWADERIRTWWYAWSWSWIIAGGPIGRFTSGIILGWRELDRLDPHRIVRLEFGVLVAIGIMLGMITAALAGTTITLIISGQLTIDRERAKSHVRARMAMAKLVAKGQSVPETVKQNMDRWGEKRYFWVPVDGDGSGIIVETLDGEKAYDHGRKRNWELVMGPGWRWIWPPNALLCKVGMNTEDIFNWPIAPAVKVRLRQAALDRTMGCNGS
ncbi:MAG: hypothetical protein TREMPRED_000578 [Tremellales sp. Tagirdzhanova-0007]|nr:MAG: hypothetical protein TREMPRED_000578 [Tremellales sp. Tagirdzhanova-0007]